MEDRSFPMVKASMIMRRSIFTFLQNFHHLTSKPTLFALPFAISTLLSQPFIPSSYLFPIVHGRLTSLFLAAGFPPTSELFTILNLKLSQTILSFIFALPFTLSFLLLAKASVIKSLEHPIKPPHNKLALIFSWIMIINPLIITQICNTLVVLSANATCFCLLIISFNLSDVLGLSSHGYLLLLSAIGAILYSIILANAYIICNFSLILSAVDKHGGFNSILKACVLIRGKSAAALSLAVPMNMALTAIEALFQYRVVRAYNRDLALNSSMVLEGMLIAYLYAVLIVLDTVVGFVFLKSCKSDQMIEIHEREEKSLGKVKGLGLVL